MRFGKTLSDSIYPPWSSHYIDYAKLKHLLREDSPSSSSSTQPEWTEHDESRFVDELVNVQLEKVYSFQKSKYQQLSQRTADCEGRLENLVHAGEQVGKEEREKVLKGVLKELDEVTKEINLLERFSRINFTGFLKAAKKHDRRSRGGKGEGPKVKPLLQVRLGHLEFNKEEYSPLLYRLSTIYDFVRRSLNGEENAVELPPPPASNHPGSTPSNKQYISHKFWVHPDNIIEVKTFILRRLPVLVYNAQPAKQIDTVGGDPSITSLYMDNSNFELYTDKVLKADKASSVRLRWYGQLSEASEIYLERKTMSGGDDLEGAVEERMALKPKYVNDFIRGNHSMEKKVEKIKGRESSEEAEKYQALVASLQKFIQDHDLQPALRASYTRTAFQIPGDDKIRISLDTDLALIREDCFDMDRPCRDPDDWHRKDIDDAKMEFPFSALRKGEIHRFPYALLEIKLRRTDQHARHKEWVQELMSSHLVHPAPRFSKFLHGVASLFDDYVNSFPFWLGDLEDDIRKDPKAAWDKEQERIQKQKEDEVAVGSFRATTSFGGRGTTPRQSPSAAGILAQAVSPGTKMLPTEPPAPVDEGDEEEDDHSDDEDSHRNPLNRFTTLFPSFSSPNYSRRHRRSSVTLPPGVQKPQQLLMYSGEVKVEAKVWLANQRTFIKWMHIVVLLSSLSVAFFNAADRGNRLARTIAMVYTGIAVFAGVWGWGIYMRRSRLIRERSGGDLDSPFGPLVVCVALMVALGTSWGLKYHEVVNRETGGGNGTVLEGVRLGGMEL